MAQATTWFSGGSRGGLYIHHGIHPSVAKLELALARIAQANAPNRTPSAQHIAHLNRTGGAGGGGGGGFGTGSGAGPAGVGYAVPGGDGEDAALQGVNIGAGAPSPGQLFANPPPVPTPNARKFQDSDLAAFLRRGT